MGSCSPAWSLPVLTAPGLGPCTLVLSSLPLLLLEARKGVLGHHLPSPSRPQSLPGWALGILTPGDRELLGTGWSGRVDPLAES